MSDSLLSNPTATGLLGGVAVVLIQLVWGRLFGAPTERSLPTQLADINTKLASIDTTLQLIQKDATHIEEAVHELKEDFWKHMDKFHQTGPGGPPPSSSAHRRV